MPHVKYEYYTVKQPAIPAIKLGNFYVWSQLVTCIHWLGKVSTFYLETTKKM